MNEQQAKNHDRNGEYWRARAEECRVKAEQMRSPHAREALLRNAEGYEGMARRADQRASREREH
jgi:hypothetical protein